MSNNYHFQNVFSNNYSKTLILHLRFHFTVHKYSFIFQQVNIIKIVTYHFTYCMYHLWSTILNLLLCIRIDWFFTIILSCPIFHFLHYSNFILKPLLNPLSLFRRPSKFYPSFSISCFGFLHFPPIQNPTNQIANKSIAY